MISIRSFSTILYKYLVLLCNFILVLYSTRLWGSEGRGFIALIITNISLVNILTNITSGSTIAYYASKRRRSVLMFINIIGALLFSITGVVMICTFWGWEEFWNYLILSLLMALSSSIAFYYLGIGKVGYYNILTILNPLVTVGCISAGTWFYTNFPIRYYFYSMYIGLAVSLLAGSWFLIKEKVVQYEHKLSFKSDLQEVVLYGFKNEVSYFFQFLCFRYSYFVVSEKIGIAALGIFSVAVAIVESIWVVSRSIATVHFSEILADNTSMEVNRQATKAKAFQSLVVSAVLSLAIIVVPAEVYGWIFGRDFKEIKIIMIYLIPGCMAISFSDLYAYYFAAVGKQDVLIKKSVLGFILLSFILGIASSLFSLKMLTVCIVMNVTYCIQSIYLLYSFRKLQ